MEGWWKDGRRVCEDRARILKQNSQYQVKLSQLSQFGGSQAKVRWSDVMGSGEGLIIFYILYFTNKYIFTFCGCFLYLSIECQQILERKGVLYFRGLNVHDQI